MKYYEKQLSGLSIIYLHNSDECYNCQLALKSDETFQNGCKKKINSKESFVDDFQPLKNLIQETKELFKNSKFKFPMPLKIKKKKKFKEFKRGCSRSNTNSKTVKPLPSKKDFKPYKEKSFKPKKSKKNLNKPIKKRTAQDGSSKMKSRSCISNKVNGSKIPGKGTLKRKRWFLNKLNDENENYEDDLYENKKFGHFQSLLEDDTDNSEKYEELKTPVFPFSISPRQRTPSPTYRDCYSPTQLSISRKGFEEYQYRRRKRKKLLSSETKETAPKVSSVISREDDIQRRLQEVSRILTIQQKEKTSDSEEDHYFSDLGDDSCKVIPNV